jgi:hypothetical protein
LPISERILQSAPDRRIASCAASSNKSPRTLPAARLGLLGLILGCLKGIATGDAIGKQTENLAREDVLRLSVAEALIVLRH